MTKELIQRARRRRARYGCDTGYRGNYERWELYDGNEVVGPYATNGVIRLATHGLADEEVIEIIDRLTMYEVR